MPARVGGVANVVRGRGLLIAGGDGIGTNASQSVRARLFCGAGPGTPFDSELVPLEPDGDFRIDGQLSGMPPAECDRPVLLIVGAGGNWLAASTPKQ